MKAYLQYRSIVCRKFADIDHLIGDNKLWNEIYSIFRTLKEEHKLSIPAIEVLNEVYLQSMRAFLVKHADEEDIWEGYVFRSRHLKSDSSATQLCLSLVYAALCLRAPDWDHVFNLASFDVDAPLPEPAHHVRSDMTTEDWMLATDHFNCAYIKEIVFRWNKKNERLQILECIETSYCNLREECPPAGTSPSGEAEKPQVMPEDFDLCRTEIETAVEVEPGSKLMAALIDRALEVFSKAGLVALLSCLTTMKYSECVKEHVERVDRAIKKPVDRAPHTQYNYYEGANHFSGNQIKGVSIHAQTEVKNFYGGIYFDRCQMTDIKFQTIVQGDMHVEATEAKPTQDDRETTEAEQKNANLNNLIFSPSLFATAERLGQLRDLIASALEQLQGKNELFWLHAALDDAEVMNFQTKDVEFINQMQEWFPDSPWLNCSARSIANAISTERNKWLQEGERVKVTNLRASRQQFVKMMQNSHKIDRFIHIAYDGLYKGVMKLKAEFQK